LRKEYLYRRSLHGEEQKEYEKKRQIQQALDAGTPLPKELRDEAAEIVEEMAYEDTVPAHGSDSAEPDNPSRIVKRQFSLAAASSQLIMDSEYARAGVYDPVIMITTSRNPSSRLTQFAKELKHVFPNSVRINRGNHVLPQLAAACRANNATDLVLVHETRGVPDGLIVSHLPYGPTAYFALLNVVLRHEIEGLSNMSQQAPHLIFENFTTKLGERVSTILKHLFPPPKDDSRRVITFANDNDFVSFRHHTYKKAGYKDVVLEEAGPRFEMQLYQIKLGTVEMTDAENEWVLRPYQNSSKKRKVL
jgi:U3 small nucleolar ribonucleoprotein protein IMP4